MTKIWINFSRESILVSKKNKNKSLQSISFDKSQSAPLDWCCFEVNYKTLRAIRISKQKA